MTLGLVVLEEGVVRDHQSCEFVASLLAWPEGQPQ
jgi:hypothetical protein